MTKDYSPQKGDGYGSNGSGIGAKLPNFFKIVSNQGVHRLRLPPEFTRRYGHNLTDDCLSLKVPNGLVWKVQLIQYSNREAWLHRGWQRFQEYYSIQLGHFLIFKYFGNSHFEVHIFDTTATEIVYSYYDSLERNALMNQVAKTESEPNDSVVFLKEILAGKNVGRKRQDVDDDNNPPPTWENKRRMQESDGLRSEKLRSSRVEQNSSSPVKKESRFLDSSPNYRSYIDKHSEGTELRYPDRKQVQQLARDGNERFKAYTRALVFMSEKPTRNLFAIVVMHPSYVSTRRSALHVPSAFAKEISPGNRNCSILLVSEGKTWLVRCVCGKQGATFTTGWRKFVEDNDLKVGDACVFEVSKRIDLALDVIIFRG